ncbi:MAG TPA: di-heme oxidoredictase family protein, partial [Steroidobacteraceae bacterium]|nr:di-heme oxidoredictase family protein [Steroidobacteraceae bacterium]
LAKQHLESTQNKMRTAPLWGLRLRPRLMHDGAALSLRDAILRHHGEAQDESKKFDRLSRQDQEALLEFLRSL